MRIIEYCKEKIDFLLLYKRQFNKEHKTGKNYDARLMKKVLNKTSYKYVSGRKSMIHLMVVVEAAVGQNVIHGIKMVLAKTILCKTFSFSFIARLADFNIQIGI